MNSFKLKRAKNLLSGIILSCCCFFGYYLMSGSVKMNLGDFERASGRVIQKEIIPRTSSTAKVNLDLEGFEFQIYDSGKLFRYYTPSQNYQSINSTIDIGDSVIVYHEAFEKKNGTVNVVQIEKDGAIIVKLDNFKEDKNTAAIIALLGGIVLLSLTIYLDCKHWKRK